MELKRRGVQDLASVIAAAESLVEFNKEHTRHHDTGSSDDDELDEVHREESPKRDRPSKDRGKWKQHETSKSKIECFLCNGPHRVSECPMKEKLSAIIMRDEKPKPTHTNIGRLASMSLLSNIPTEERGPSKGRMYVETIVKGTMLKATVDTDADDIYMAKELAEEIGLKYKRERGFVKGVNAECVAINGRARGIDIRIGPWEGKIDITVTPLDEKKFYLGMGFFNRVKSFVVPYANTLFILDRGKEYTVPVKREPKKDKMLSSLEFIEDTGTTFIASLKSSMHSRDEQQKGQEGVTTKTPKRRRSRKKRTRSQPPKVKEAQTKKGVQSSTRDRPTTRTLLKWVGENVTECSRTRRIHLEHLGRSKVIGERSRTLNNLQGCTRTFRNIQKYYTSF